MTIEAKTQEIKVMGETLCEWQSGVGTEPVWDCECCKKPIPAGGNVHFISDGGYDPREGTYVGECCLWKCSNCNGRFHPDDNCTCDRPNWDGPISQEELNP